MIFCFFFSFRCELLQVSWVRHRDIHLLTVGRYTYTSDQRFEALHSPHTEEWTLRIRYAQRKDSGIYEVRIYNFYVLFLYTKKKLWLTFPDASSKSRNFKFFFYFISVSNFNNTANWKIRILINSR